MNAFLQKKAQNQTIAKLVLRLSNIFFLPEIEQQNGCGLREFNVSEYFCKRSGDICHLSATGLEMIRSLPLSITMTIIYMVYQRRC